MTVELKDYTLEIKVNGKGMKKISDSVDTKYFLNKISLAFDLAGKWLKNDDCPVLSGEYSELATEIHDFLKDIGFYG